MSKLVNIVLNHRFSILGCARQNLSQRCPSLTRFLPKWIPLCLPWTSISSSCWILEFLVRCRNYSIPPVSVPSLCASGKISQADEISQLQPHWFGRHNGNLSLAVPTFPIHHHQPPLKSRCYRFCSKLSTPRLVWGRKWSSKRPVRLESRPRVCPALSMSLYESVKLYMTFVLNQLWWKWCY